ncbi:MAG TPA: TetR/AcrR family transcriptional regulator [Rhizomicrobium sp.]|nr:TetR/AcrR family transcriptional regulator [Rhizomicrobium sp.]
MARPKEFDTDAALDGAIRLFSEHGYEGTSAQMLVDTMGIGRQSLYDTFGGKWQLYRSALRRYGSGECSAHFQALRKGSRAIDGLSAMLDRVVETAATPCLGMSSIHEFGTSKPDITEIHEPLSRVMNGAIAAQIREAQRDGDVAADLDPDIATHFLISAVAGIRLAGRGGADQRTLKGLAEIAMRALR